MVNRVRDLDAVVGRADLLRVDPRKVKIRAGFNPRTTFVLDDLMASIKECGVLQAILVRKNEHQELELVDGERRLRSCLALIEQGVEILSIPALLVQHRTSDADLLATALVTNHSENLSPRDEADAFARLEAYGWTAEQIAQKIGRSVGYVRNRLTLLDMTPSVLELLNNGVIGTTEAVNVIRQAERDGTTQLEAVTRRQESRARRPRKPRPEPVLMDGAATWESALRTTLATQPLDAVLAVILETTTKTALLQLLEGEES